MKPSIRISPLSWLAAGLLTGLSALPAQAHFLWAELAPGTTPVLQLKFVEQANEKTTPELLAKLKPSKVWTAKGETPVVKPGDGALETVVPEGTRLVAAVQTWGVMDRSAQGRGVFLLEYYAKAAADLNAAGQSAKLPVEAFVKREGDSFVVLVKQEGKAARDAEIVLQRPGNGNLLALKTDAAGKTQFKSAGEGLYGLHATVAEKRSGSYEGKNYDLIRHYTTLTFHVGASSTITASNTKTKPAKADPEAWNLLKSAHDRRWTLPQDFPGLRGEVVYNDGGQVVEGTFTYAPKTGVVLELKDNSNQKPTWLQSQISNFLAHRRGGDFAKGDGSHPITFSEDMANNPLGRQVELNDGLHSSYRVQDKTVVEVTRTMGDSRFTITVLETQTVDDGRYLPRHFVVTYFHARSGAVQKTESFSDTFAKQGATWLPVSRRVVLAENGKVTARTFELRNLQFDTKKTADARP